MNKDEKRIQVIYVTNDDQKLFSMTMKARTFFGLPPSKFNTVKQVLCKKYGFDQKADPPHLVLFDSRTGEMITKYAVDKILSDPGGRRFPWHPNLIRSLRKVYKPTETSLFPFFALFFADEHCVPEALALRRLTEALGSEKVIRVVVVSCDAFKFKFKPWYDKVRHEAWLEYPFDEKHKTQLFDLYRTGPHCGPQLTILSRDLTVIHLQALDHLKEDDGAKGFPWDPQFESEWIDLVDITGMRENDTMLLAKQREALNAKSQTIKGATAEDEASRSRGSSAKFDSEKFQRMRQAFFKESKFDLE